MVQFWKELLNQFMHLVYLQLITDIWVLFFLVSLGCEQNNCFQIVGIRGLEV